MSHVMKRVDEVTQHGGRHQQAYGEHGTLKTEPVKFLVKDDAQPYAVHTARRVPLPMLQKVKEELQRIESNGVIEQVTQPTDWRAPVVPVLEETVCKLGIVNS